MYRYRDIYTQISTHGLKCSFRIQGGGRFCTPPLGQLYPYKTHPVRDSRNRISVRARIHTHTHAFMQRSTLGYT